MASTLQSSKQRVINCLLLEYFFKKGYNKAIIELQKESRCVFDPQYFNEIVNEGKWKDALAYFSAFTDIKSNRASRNIVYHILKQKFMEALNGERYVEALKCESEIKGFSDVADDFDVTEMLKTEEYRLEVESLMFFNMKRFEQLIMEGHWNDAKIYLSAFAEVDDITRILFEITQQKALEFGYENHRLCMGEVYLNEIRPLLSKDDFKEDLKKLLKVYTIRDIEHLYHWKDVRSSREHLAKQLKEMIRLNPVLKDKLHDIQLGGNCQHASNLADGHTVAFILQCLEKYKLTSSLHQFEMESQMFSLKHFEKLILDGDWNEVSLYLSAFTRTDSNAFSTKMFFEIIKQEAIELLYIGSFKFRTVLHSTRMDYFRWIKYQACEEFISQISHDLEFRNSELSYWKDEKSSREILARELKEMIQLNPDLKHKLYEPTTIK